MINEIHGHNSRALGNGGGHYSLSPSRITSSRINFNNSEVSDTAAKKMSLHTYHIRNKNGSPTAQVQILKDVDDVAFDEPGDTASASQSTTKVSMIPNQKTPSKFH
jgi:hypothetical protein